MPIQWAGSTAAEGDALLVLAERLGDARTAQRAISQIELAIGIMRDGHVNVTDYSEQLSKARALFEQLNNHHKPASVFGTAVGSVRRWFGFEKS